MASDGRTKELRKGSGKVAGDLVLDALLNLGLGQSAATAGFSFALDPVTTFPAPPCLFLGSMPPVEMMADIRHLDRAGDKCHLIHVNYCCLLATLNIAGRDVLTWASVTVGCPVPPDSVSTPRQDDRGRQK